MISGRKHLGARAISLKWLLLLIVVGGTGIAWKKQKSHQPPEGYIPAEYYREKASKIDPQEVASLRFEVQNFEITDPQDISLLLEALRNACWPEEAQGKKNRGGYFDVMMKNGKGYRFNFAGLYPEAGFGPEFSEALTQIGRNRTREFKHLLAAQKIDRIRLCHTLEIKSGKPLDEILTALQSVDDLFDYVNDPYTFDVEIETVDGKVMTFSPRLSWGATEYKPEMKNPPYPRPLWRLICEAERRETIQSDQEDRNSHSEKPSNE